MDDKREGQDLCNMPFRWSQDLSFGFTSIMYHLKTVLSTSGVMMLRIITIALTVVLIGVDRSSAQTLTMDGGVNHLVRCIEVANDSTRLLVGGSFRYAGGLDSLHAKALVAWENGGWNMSGLADGSGDDFPDSFQSGHILYDMANFHDTLFCRTSMNWQQNPDLKQINLLVNGAWYPNTDTPGENGGYAELLPCNGRLFAGGDADSMSSAFMPGVKEWYGGAWHHVLGCPFEPGTSDILCATYWHSKFYFGGLFFGTTGNRVIAYDGVDQWEPVGEGIGQSWVRAIVGFGDTLYAGGFIYEDAEHPTRHMRLWDGVSWKSFFPDVLHYMGQPWAMQVYKGKLYVLGVFRFNDEDTDYGLLRFDGQQLCAIGGPSGGESTAMAFARDTLYYALPSYCPGLEQQWIGQLPLTDLVPDRCISVTTGIKEHAGVMCLEVYPVPARDELRFDLPLELQGRSLVLRITNALGEQVVRDDDVSRPVIDIHALPPGCYSGALEGRNVFRTFRFLKQ